MRLLPRLGVVVACTVIVAAAFWSGLLTPAQGIAFADVQQQLQKQRTVRYVSTRLAEFAGDDPEERREMERKAIEEGVKVDPHRVFRVLGNSHQPRIIKIMGRYLQRTEVLNDRGAVDHIQISDSEHGKHVTLDPRKKEFLEFTTQVTLHLDGSDTSKEKIQPSPEVDLFARISEIPAEAATQLPERLLGGRRVIGFFSRQTTPTSQGTETWERTYWVDPETKLPVRIETSYYATDPRIGRSDWISSGFVFDEPIPAEEFSTALPEGYTHKTAEIMGIKVD